MKTAVLKFNVSDDFEKGNCNECSLYVPDDKFEFLDYCVMHCSYDECPLVISDKTETKNRCTKSDIFDKLAAYEDAGLEPEEVETLKAENAELKRLLRLAISDMKRITDAIRDFGSFDDYKFSKELNDYDVGRCNICKYFGKEECDRECVFCWLHADEAEKLLGR